MQWDTSCRKSERCQLMVHGLARAAFTLSDRVPPIGGVGRSQSACVRLYWSSRFWEQRSSNAPRQTESQGSPWDHQSVFYFALLAESASNGTFSEKSREEK